MALTLVVMAAGKGSRFGGMKQVAEIGPSGEALLDYAVYDALRSGFEEVVFVVSEESRAAVEEHVEKGCGRHVKVRYALQAGAEGRKKPWGTGHAVLSACDEFDYPFGVVNADDFYGQKSFDVLGRELAADDTDHLLVAFKLKESLSPNGGVSRGLCRVEDGFLTSIKELHDVEEEKDGKITSDEESDLTGDELISANLWGFQPSFCRTLAEQFEEFKEQNDDPSAEFLIGDAVASLRDTGGPRVRVEPTPERFLGITYSEDVAGVRGEVAAMVDDGRYPSPLWK